MHRILTSSAARLAARVRAVVALGGAFVILLASTATTRADVFYEQRVTSVALGGVSGNTGTNRIYIKGDSERSEMTMEVRTDTGELGSPGQMLSITRLDRELIWYLDPGTKTYSETTFADLRAHLGDAKSTAEAAESAVSVERTGKKDRICGAPAEQVVLTIESPLTDPALKAAKQYLVAELWLAKDFPGAPELEAHSRATVEALGHARAGVAAGNAASPIAHLMARLTAEMRKLEGTAIRTITSLELDAHAGVPDMPSPVPAHGEGRQVVYAITSEISHIESKELDAALFEIPAGYTKVERQAPGRRPTEQQGEDRR